MSETATRLPRARTSQPKKPVWAEVLDTFYANSFDASSSEALTDCADAFAELSDTDRAFHQAHLTYRQVQALGDIYGCLRRIEAGLPDPKTVRALLHLPGIRKALVVIAKGQEEMLELLEAGGQSARGEPDEDEDDEERSDLSDAVDLDEVEEEDHGNGDGEALVPEVLPASARRPATAASEVA
ncbi:MAG: hypothetical protein Q8P18_03655 [Pseudomonadota bacterium]|nr:hypothetical protein [Pseudomonadota bacterium]